MLLEYLKFYFRIFKRNKTAYTVSLMCLGLGISGALLTYFFIQRELSFDSFTGNSEKIYRIVFGKDDGSGSALTSSILGKTIAESYPGVKAVRFNNAGNARVNFKYGDKQYMESTFLFTDFQIFDVFPFSLAAGNKSNCLQAPFTVVITRNIAQKFFGTEDALGKSISMNWGEDFYELSITGIIDELPQNSHIKFEYLISMATAERIFQPMTFFTDWTANFCYSYLKIDNDETKNQIEGSLTDIYLKNVKTSLPSTTQLRLQPLERIHLYSKLSSEISQNSDIRYVYIAASLGTLIFLVSLINYVNILSALSTKRQKEIGIRKVLGAKSSSIVGQFASESIGNILICLLLALLLISLTSSILQSVFGFSIDPYIVLQKSKYVTALILVLGVASGFYLAFALTNQNVSDVLYGKNKLVGSRSGIRNIMVGVQIFIAFMIMVGAIVIQKQLSFIESNDLGYSKESLLTIPQGRAIRENSEFVKSEMASTGKVISSTLSSHLPSKNLNFKVPALVEGGNPDGTNEAWPVAVVSVDYDFFETYQLKLIGGRFFSSEFPSDSTQGFIINQSVANALHWDSPLGKEIQMTYNVGDGTIETRKGKVIGVINDFHFESMHKAIEPMVFIHKPFWFYYLSIKVSEGNTAETISRLESKWNALLPDVPFEYTFMTDRLKTLYETEQSWAKGISILSFVAISISCLGLFGLVAFMIQGKMREIAIRKILGASPKSILARLYGNIFLIILTAAVLAIPAAWYFSNQWLAGFAYRISVGFEIFLIAIVIVSLVSSLVILGQITKASRLNSVDVLKIE